MGVVQQVKDGKFVDSNSAASLAKAKEKLKGGNTLDKDAFLQLLVAQMKYQDPLEPTSNTEYIAQYATFSQVEQMQNMASTMELTRASSMVGKLVEVETTDSNGDSKKIQGKVEFVSYENNKAFVSINGQRYSADDVVAVVDEGYQSALELAVSFSKAVSQLPSLEYLTVKDKEAVETLQKGFNSMTAYQQSFIPEEYITKLQKYVEQMAKLVEAAESNKGDGEETGKTEEDTEGKGDTETTEGTEGVENEGSE